MISCFSSKKILWNQNHLQVQQAVPPDAQHIPQPVHRLDAPNLHACCPKTSKTSNTKCRTPASAKTCWRGCWRSGGRAGSWELGELLRRRRMWVEGGVSWWRGFWVNQVVLKGWGHCRIRRNWRKTIIITKRSSLSRGKRILGSRRSRFRCGRTLWGRLVRRWGSSRHWSSN